jgi:hypothetical protein
MVYTAFPDMENLASGCCLRVRPAMSLQGVRDQPVAQQVMDELPVDV